MSFFLAALALASLALAVYLVIAPIAISLRAPDAGDLFFLRITHPSFALDLWLTPERAAEMAVTGAVEFVRLPRNSPLPSGGGRGWVPSSDGWTTIAGKIPLPGILGHLLGIPFDSSTVAWLRDRGLSIYAWNARRPKKPKKEKPEKKPKGPSRPASDWLRVASEVRPRLLEAMRIDRLEIDLEYGTGDPSTTGFLAAAIWQVCTLLPAPCRIHAQAHWAEPRFHLEGEAKLLIFPWRVGRAILSLWLAMRRKPARQEPPAAIQEIGHVRAER